MKKEMRTARAGKAAGAPRMGELKVALGLIQRLARGPASLAELQKVVALHHRSVRRYLKAFEAVGLGVTKNFKLSKARQKTAVWWIPAGRVIDWLLTFKSEKKRGRS